MTASTTANGGNRQREKRILAENRQASHHYEFHEHYEAGIKLQGWEVKAILSGLANFNGAGAYVDFSQQIPVLKNTTITPQAQTMRGGLSDVEPQRDRQLLLRAAELKKLKKKVATAGFTVVPVRLTYERHVKLEIALAKGKNHADKREAVKRREQDREAARAERGRY